MCHVLIQSFGCHSTCLSSFFSYHHRSHQALPSFPTRRSSDLHQAHERMEYSREHREHESNSGDGELRLCLPGLVAVIRDRKSTRLNSSHVAISYAVFCLKKKKIH